MFGRCGLLDSHKKLDNVEVVNLSRGTGRSSDAQPLQSLDSLNLPNGLNVFKGQKVLD